MTGCKVELFHVGLVSDGKARVHPKCGHLVVAHGLCAKHLADRLRLGGTT